MHDKILILDFGSQVTQLIARRVREAHVFCEIHPNDVGDAFIRDFAPKAIILSGSHASTYEEHDLRAPQAVWDLGVPVLGICYGMFTMTVQQGGQVEAANHREFGYAEVRAHGHTKLLKGIEDFSTPEGHGMLKVWMSHGDKVTALPPGFKLMASTPSCPIAGMADEARGYYGVQFHPEVTHTVQGRALLERFVLQIAGAKPDWVMHDHIGEAVARIREQVGSEEVILGLSGGVDSSVAAALIHRAIGDQLTCVFVDHGLLRRADAIFIEELRAATDAGTGKNWYDLTSQAFAVFLPVKSVGVMGDGRTYDFVVALRAVQTSDFMTADWAELPYSLLKKVSSRIINEVRGINRVTYDVSSKPPATIEWE